MLATLNLSSLKTLGAHLSLFKALTHLDSNLLDIRIKHAIRYAM